MTLIKICGITRMEDAQHAIACGADMLGFNFYPRSPRYIDPAEARKITAALPFSVGTVGVFVNAPPSDVRRIAEVSGMTSVQLHGSESYEDCVALSDLKPIKAFKVENGNNGDAAARFAEFTVLLDAATPEFGGSGNVIDWAVARRIKSLLPKLFLAGGLSESNVVEAIAAVAPSGVDACSLLEASPGVKDHEKVERFIAAIRATERVPARSAGEENE